MKSHQKPVVFKYRVLFVIYFSQFFFYIKYIKFGLRVLNNLLLHRIHKLTVNIWQIKATWDLTTTRDKLFYEMFMAKNRKTRYSSIEIFTNIELQIDTVTNLKEVNFLDISNLTNRTFHPYKTTNDKNCCISTPHPTIFQKSSSNQQK